MASFEPRLVESATVVKIDDGLVWIDIGRKFESSLPISDWPTPGSQPTVGDSIAVLIEDDVEVDDRPLKIVRVFVRRTPLSRRFERFAATANVGADVEGRIQRKIDGGFLVDIGVTAFLPLDQIERGNSTDTMIIGQTLTFRIREIDNERKSVVLEKTMP